MNLLQMLREAEPVTVAPDGDPEGVDRVPHHGREMREELMARLERM